MALSSKSKVIGLVVGLLIGTTVTWATAVRSSARLRLTYSLERSLSSLELVRLLDAGDVDRSRRLLEAEIADNLRASRILVDQGIRLDYSPLGANTKERYAEVLGQLPERPNLDLDTTVAALRGNDES